MKLTAMDNGASALLLETRQTSVLVDSYFGHPYVAPVGLVYRSWRSSAPEPVPPQARRVAAIVITSREGDHLQPEALEAFDRALPVFAERQAILPLRRLGFHQVQALRPPSRVQVGPGLEVLALTGYHPLFTPHLALLFRDEDGATALVAPHGVVQSRSQARAIEAFLAGVEPAHFRIGHLPRSWLPHGGTITPDVLDVTWLLEVTRPQRVVLFHDTADRRGGLSVRYGLTFPRSDRYRETSAAALRVRTAADVSVGLPPGGLTLAAPGQWGLEW